MLFNNELGTAISWNGTFNTTMKTIEKFWSPEWVKLVFKLADMIQKLELSLEEIVLIRVIILTYTGIIIRAYKKEVQSFRKLQFHS
jgi:hypothetical protein